MSDSQYFLRLKRLYYDFLQNNDHFFSSMYIYELYKTILKTVTTSKEEAVFLTSIEQQTNLMFILCKLLPETDKNKRWEVLKSLNIMEAIQYKFYYIPHDVIQDLVLNYGSKDESLLNTMYIYNNGLFIVPRFLYDYLGGEEKVRKFCAELLLQLKIVEALAQSMKVALRPRPKFYLLCSPISLKYFPKSGTTICYNENHINSAECDTKNGIINIYRLEEVHKVFFHECIHYYNLDGRKQYISVKAQGIISQYVNNTGEKFYEAITETLAEIINIMYVNIMESGNLNDFHRMYLKEVLFGDRQSAYILRHYLLTGEKFSQSTACFEYHIMKSLYMHHIHDFLKIYCTQPRRKLNDLLDLFVHNFNIGKYHLRVPNNSEKQSSRMSIIERT